MTQTSSHPHPWKKGWNEEKLVTGKGWQLPRAILLLLAGPQQYCRGRVCPLAPMRGCLDRESGARADQDLPFLLSTQQKGWGRAGTGSRDEEG